MRAVSDHFFFYSSCFIDPHYCRRNILQNSLLMSPSSETRLETYCEEDLNAHRLPKFIVFSPRLYHLQAVAHFLYFGLGDANICEHFGSYRSIELSRFRHSKRCSYCTENLMTEYIIYNISFLLLVEPFECVPSAVIKTAFIATPARKYLCAFAMTLLLLIQPQVFLLWSLTRCILFPLKRRLFSSLFDMIFRSFPFYNAYP